MKKLLSLILVLVLVFSLVSCAKSPETSEEQEEAPAENATTEEPAEEPEEGSEEESAEEPAEESGDEPYADVTREPRELHWASGGSTGQGYITGSVMAGLLPEYYEGYSVIPEVTTGGVANAQMLLDGLGDFISMQSDDAMAFNTNQRDWVDMPECTDKLRMVCVFSDTWLNIIAAADDDSIQSFTDLKGKRVAVLAGTTRDYALQYLLQVHGMTEDDFAELSDMGRNDMVTAFKNGSVDCIIDMIAFGNSAYQELSYTGSGIKMVPLSDEAIEAMQEINPTYLKGTIPADTYNGVTDTPAIKLYNLYLTYKEMPDYVVYDVLKCMYENNEELKAAHPKAGMDMDQEAFYDHIENFELHPGAEAFYREIGWLE